MAIFVQLIIGEFELIKWYDLLHPCTAWSWWVGMHMNTRRWYWIRFSGNYPTRAKKKMLHSIQWHWHTKIQTKRIAWNSQNELFVVNKVGNKPMKWIAVAFIINGNKIHHRHIHCLRIQIANTNLKCWKHASSGLCDNHFGSLLMKFIPQWFCFQYDIGVHKCWMIVGRIFALIDSLTVVVFVVHIRFLVKGANCCLLKIIRHTLIDVLQWLIRTIFSGRLNACCMKTPW